MTKLTSQQQREVEQLRLYALTIARSFSSDDEYESEAMLALCQAVAAYDPARGPLPQFVGTCVRNRLIKKLTRTVGPKAYLSETPDVWPDTTPHLGVYEAIAALPDDLHDIAEARWLDGRTLKQLAEQFGLTVGAVRRRLAKARSTLRSSLDSIPFLDAEA